MGLQNYIYWYLLFPRKSSFSGTILENYFGGDPLRMRASCQCSSGVHEAVNRLVGLVGFRCTNLVGSNGEAPETTITFSVFLRKFMDCCDHLLQFT